ncbi:MAG: hypothetical protein HYW26_04440 [Candidatus Aenigmarchaeota archaeon]|nr:hypothetical protein [Candidatus Aenigmarchaeota archaeon]
MFSAGWLRANRWLVSALAHIGFSFVLFRYAAETGEFIIDQSFRGLPIPFQWWLEVAFSAVLGICFLLIGIDDLVNGGNKESETSRMTAR